MEYDVLALLLHWMLPTRGPLGGDPGTTPGAFYPVGPKSGRSAPPPGVSDGRGRSPVSRSVCQSVSLKRFSLVWP